MYTYGLPRRLSDKESTCNGGTWARPLVGKIPWRRNWQPTAVFLPGEPHGQRSLAQCSSVSQICCLLGKKIQQMRKERNKHV